MDLMFSMGTWGVTIVFIKRHVKPIEMLEISAA
jgi:hypothetical protein